MYVGSFSKDEIEILKSLCSSYPYYSINQLAKEMNKSASEVFMIIKTYDLPYNWKAVPKS